VLLTADSSEIRWVLTVPEPGELIHGRFEGTWLVVDEVVPSGARTYTVFASRLREDPLDEARDDHYVEPVYASLLSTRHL
jgi:hypothetical protein